MSEKITPQETTSEATPPNKSDALFDSLISETTTNPRRYVDKKESKQGLFSTHSHDGVQDLRLLSYDTSDSPQENSTSTFTIIRKRADWTYWFYSNESSSKEERVARNDSLDNMDDSAFTEVTEDEILPLLEKFEQRVNEGKQQEQTEKLERIKKAADSAQNIEESPEDGLKDLV